MPSNVTELITYYTDHGLNWPNPILPGSHYLSYYLADSADNINMAVDVASGDSEYFFY